MHLDAITITFASVKYLTSSMKIQRLTQKISNIAEGNKIWENKLFMYEKRMLVRILVYSHMYVLLSLSKNIGGSSEGRVLALQRS